MVENIRKHKKLVLSVLGVLVIAVGFWGWKRWKVGQRENIAPVVENSVKKSDAVTEDIVWYEIPEMGIRIRVSKEYAKDLTYRYSQTYAAINDEPKYLEEYVWFGSKELTEADSNCDNSALGAIGKIQGHPDDYGNLAINMETVQIFDKFFLFGNFTLPERNCVNDYGKGDIGSEKAFQLLFNKTQELASYYQKGMDILK